jgi:DNA-binding GntR family transcriptional regulator
LSEKALAERFGVSRTPVRAALRALAGEKLVEFVHRRGAVVSTLSVAEVRELFLLRSLLEGPAARLAAESGHSRLNAMAELSRLIDEVEASSQVPGRWLAVERRFHMTIYQASGLPRLVSMIASLRDDIERYVSLYIGLPDSIPSSNHQHRLIFEAFSSGDAALCERRTLDHLRSVGEGYLRALESKED